MTKDNNLSPIDANRVRIVLVPENTTRFKTTKFADPATAKETEYLVAEGQLYELNKTDFKDAYNDKEVLTNGHRPLKSLILTKSEGDCLVLGRTPELFVVTPYNIVYFVLAFFEQALKQETVRLVPYDDIIEQMEFRELVSEDTLKAVCNSVVENDETFYQASKEKAIEYLKGKVQAIADHFPESIDSKLTRKLTRNLDGAVGDEIKHLAREEVAIDLLSSYISPFYVELLQKQYDFSPLQRHLADLAALDEKARIAEDNLLALNENLHKKRKLPAKKVAQKKTAPKVAVGRGALDMFFKHK